MFVFSGHPEPYPAEAMFRGFVDRVHDGDTIDVVCDLGFDAALVATVRIIGVDTWEIVGVNAEKGKAARAWLTSLILGQPVLIFTQKKARSPGYKTSFERYLARVQVWIGGAWLDLAAIFPPEHIKQETP